MNGRTKSSLNNLKKILFGKQISYEFETHEYNRKGKVEAEIVGGNLSILFSLLGSNSQLNTTGKILFIEDLDEYLYHIDRMMHALERAGMLTNLAGLLVGGMSEMNDHKIPFGKSAEQIIRDITLKYDFPIAYNFPGIFVSYHFNRPNRRSSCSCWPRKHFTKNRVVSHTNIKFSF